jgi:sec-independent protein translocase protein TatA
VIRLRSGIISPQYSSSDLPKLDEIEVSNMVESIGLASLTPAFLPSIGWQETLVIFGIILFIFGPQKLPEIADALGKSIRRFKNATTEIKNDIESDNTNDPS